MTCALPSAPPISGQVTVTRDLGHRGGGELFRFRKQKSGVCTSVLWNFRGQTVFWVVFTAFI